MLISLTLSGNAAAESTGAAAESKPQGCIVSLQTGEKYCLPVGQRSGYSLPESIRGHEVRVENEEGAAVMLSDWDNLSYNRIAVFEGTKTNSQLENVRARNGENLDFSQPRSMRVVASDKKLGCIVSLENGEKYCLPVGERSPYGLPSWIYNHQVYVQANQGAAVMLSDWDNLSYNRLAVFHGTVDNAKLKNVRAYNGENLDFSHPRSMRVVASDKPLGCIVSLETGAKYCMPAGERSGYSLPNWIAGHEVDVVPSLGAGVMLSDWDNLSYNRIGGFGCRTPNRQLESVLAWNGEYLDFSRPRSMRVVADNRSSDQVIEGTAGDDELYGCNGNDTITGYAGNDFADGGAGDDTIYGNADNDILHGGPGNDSIFGAGGEDQLFGDEGNDYLEAGFDDDVIVDGGEGVDRYRGNEGNDTFVFGQDDFSNEAMLTQYGTMYNGDRGFDVLKVNGDANIDFSGSSYYASGTVPGTKAIVQVEAVVADNGNQTVTINANAVYAQSDNFQQQSGVQPGDWHGFVAYLADGEDVLNVEAGVWQYNPDAQPEAVLSNDMINFLQLSFDDITRLHAYVFEYAGKKVAIWTDAETVQADGNNL
ncbi:calcium-binding protein [Enterovibrio sp. NIFS-20-8]|nr:calcium-binding protein [Enterovibrio paralichthyis]